MTTTAAAPEGDPDHSPILQAFAFLVVLHGVVHLFRAATWASFELGIEYWYASVARFLPSPIEILLLIAVLTFIWIAAAAACTCQTSPTRASRMICVCVIFAALGHIAYVSMMQASKPRFVEMLQSGLAVNLKALENERRSVSELEAADKHREARWLKETLAGREGQVRRGRRALEAMTGQSMPHRSTAPSP